MKRFPLSKLTFLLIMLLSLVLITAQAASAASLNDYTWKIVKSPNGGLDNSELHGIAAISQNDVWTEGSYDTSAGSIFHTLIEHWNGSQWSVARSPSPGTNDFLNDLSAVSASDVWTVGNSTINGVAQTLIEHWNGSQWS